MSFKQNNGNADKGASTSARALPSDIIFPDEIPHTKRITLQEPYMYAFSNPE